MSVFDDFGRLQSTINQMMGDFGRRGGLVTPTVGLGGGLPIGTTFDPFWEISDVSWDTMLPLTTGIGQQPLLGKGEEESKMGDVGAGTALTTQQRGAGQLPVLRCRVNVEDQEKLYAVTAEMPGFDKENIKVNISDDNILTIHGEQKKEHIEEAKNKKFLRTERAFGVVRRSLRLPRTIDKANVCANYVNGILHINVPKKEDAARKHQVQVA